MSVYTGLISPFHRDWHRNSTIFGIFSRNKNIPDLLEIEMFKYKRDVESYMEYREDQKWGK